MTCSIFQVLESPTFAHLSSRLCNNPLRFARPQQCTCLRFVASLHRLAEIRTDWFLVSGLYLLAKCFMIDA